MTDSKRKQFGLFLFVFFFILISVLVFLPQVLLSKSILERILPVVNEKMDGTLNVGTCTGGWFKKIECSSVKFADTDGKTFLSVEKVSTDRGFFTFLAAHQNLGRITLYDPAVDFLYQAPGDIMPSAGNVENGPGNQGSIERPQDSPALPVEKKDSVRPLWEGINAELHIINGTVSMRDGNEKATVLFDSAQLGAHLGKGTVTYNFDLKSTATSGKLTGAGFFNLPVDNRPISPDLVSKTDLEIDDFDLSALLSFSSALTARAAIPSGSGLINGSWSVQTAGIRNITIRGKSDAREVRLEGGYLGEDEAAFDRIDCAADFKIEDGVLEIEGIKLVSDPLTFHGKGKVKKDAGSLKVEGEVDIPQFLTIFQHRIGLNNNITVQEGKAPFSFIYQRTDVHTADLSFDFQTDLVRAKLYENEILWDDPFTMAFTAQQKNGVYSLPRLELVTPFAELAGSEEQEAFAIEGRIDLEKFSREMNIFLGTDLIAGGELTLKGHSSFNAEQENSGGLFLYAENFALHDSTGQLVPAAPVNLSFAGTFSGWKKMQTQDLDLEITFDSWLGSGEILFTDFAPARLMSGAYELTSSLELEPVSQFVQTLFSIDEPYFTSGNIHIESSGNFNTNSLMIASFALDGTDVQGQFRDVVYQDKKISLSLLPDSASTSSTVVSVQPLKVAAGWKKYKKQQEAKWSVVNFDTRTLRFNEFTFDSGVIQLPSASFTVRDWTDIGQGVSGSFLAQFPMGPFVEILQQKNIVPSGLTITGSSTLSGQVATVNKIIGTHINCRIEGMDLVENNISVFDDQQFGFEATIEFDPQNGKMYVAPYTMRADFLSLEGTMEKNPNKGGLIYTSNIFTSDFRPLARYLRSRYSKNFQFAGDDEHWLESQFSPGRKDGFSLSYEGSFDQLIFDDTVLSNLFITLDIGQNSGTVSWNGEFNGGLFQGPLHYSHQDNKKMIYADQGVTVLKEVILDRNFIDAFLSRQLPLLSRLVQPEGTLSLQVEEFNLPVDNPEEVIFRTVTDTSDISLASAGVIKEILALFQLENEPLVLQETSVQCIGAEQRVQCDPVHILVADSEMTIHGSVGFDGALDYILEVPVTEKLIGREGYRILQDTTIFVPIQGTVEAPLFSRERVGELIAGVLAQVAREAIENKLEQVVPDLWDKLLGR